MTNLEYANGLRALASFYESNADMPLPWPMVNVFLYDREEFLRAAVVLSRGGRVEKKADELGSSLSYYHAIRHFGPIPLDVTIDRKTVCRLIRPAEYECPDSLLEAAKEYTHAAAEPELADQETAQDIAATAKESIEAAQ